MCLGACSCVQVTTSDCSVTLSIVSSDFLPVKGSSCTFTCPLYSAVMTDAKNVSSFSATFIFSVVKTIYSLSSLVIYLATSSAARDDCITAVTAASAAIPTNESVWVASFSLGGVRACRPKEPHQPPTAKGMKLAGFVCAGRWREGAASAARSPPHPPPALALWTAEEVAPGLHKDACGCRAMFHSSATEEVASFPSLLPHSPLSLQ